MTNARVFVIITIQEVLLVAIDVNSVIKGLSSLYPDARPELVYNNPYQLIVAVILSAQCTDKRVNMVTPALFDRYPTVFDLAEACPDELQQIIKPCGFFRNKAANLIAMAKKVSLDFGGEIPADLDELQSLSGVGRKTANVVYSVAFQGDAIAVDTHVFRVANRIGLADSKDVLGTEKDLMRVIPQADWSRAHHLLIFHGRRVCKARKPLCNECKIKDLCKSYGGKNV